MTQSKFLQLPQNSTELFLQRELLFIFSTQSFGTIFQYHFKNFKFCAIRFCFKNAWNLVMNLTINFFRALECFAEPLFWPIFVLIFLFFHVHLFISLFISYCKRLTYSRWLNVTWVMWLVLCTSILYHFFIVVFFIVSTCEHNYIEKNNSFAWLSMLQRYILVSSACLKNL